MYLNYAILGLSFLQNQQRLINDDVSILFLHVNCTNNTYLNIAKWQTEFCIIFSDVIQASTRHHALTFTPPLSKVFEKIVAEKLSHVESNSVLPPSKFLYRRGLETCDAFLTFSHNL